MCACVYLTETIFIVKHPTKRDFIEAKGHVLAFYLSDLFYIDNFNRAKKGELLQIAYLDKNKEINNSFRQFVWDFRVVRNVRAGQLSNLLGETIKWCKGKNADDVDLFKQKLRAKEICHEKNMTSLSSKVLFLNNPEFIHPYDDLAKKAVGYKGKSYSEYLLKVDEYKKVHKQLIGSLYNDIRQELDSLDKVFNEIRKSSVNTKVVRNNRIVDKLLWTIGKNNGKLES